MRALRYLGPNKLEIQEVEKPTPKADEVLVKVMTCGICGSDVHGALGLTGRRIAPMTMGHEFAGEIAEVGSNVVNSKVGDRVVVQPIGFCGECVNCNQGMTNMCLNKNFFGVLTVDGAMAEYVSVPEKLVYKLPDGASYEVGALTEPYAVGYGAVSKIDSFENKNVLVIGAGTIGLGLIQLIKLQNPKQIIVSDLSDSRLALAKEFGADQTVNPKNEDYMDAIGKYTDGGMIDISVEAVGVEATANQSIKALKIGGTSLWVGMSQKEMQINMQDIVCSARAVLGSFNYTHKEFGEVLEIMGSGKIDTEKLISKVVTLDEAAEAFDELHKKPDDFIKIIINPSK